MTFTREYFAGRLAHLADYVAGCTLKPEGYQMIGDDSPRSDPRFNLYVQSIEDAAKRKGYSVRYRREGEDTFYELMTGGNKLPPGKCNEDAMQIDAPAVGYYSALDTLRVLAHEVAHGMTIKRGELRDLARKGDRAGHRIVYNRDEIIADTISCLATCALVPNAARVVTDYTAQYCKLWSPLPATVIADNRDLILSSLVTMLEGV